MKLKTLTASQYYYGCPPDVWDNMLYFDALQDRWEKSRKLYFELWDEWEELKDKKNHFELEKRMFYVAKAMNFNKKLLDEREHLI